MKSIPDRNYTAELRAEAVNFGDLDDWQRQGDAVDRGSRKDPPERL